MPLTLSPHDPGTVYVGSQYVHKTTNGGQSWQVISPDLSTNDKSRQLSSGGLTPDNIGVEYAFAVMAIAESARQKGLIWAGTNDGQVQITRDGGQTWTNVTRNIPGLPPWGTVGNIEPPRHDAGTAYLTVDLHQVDNRDPFVYRTSDYGQTWKAITSGIPRSMTSYAHCIREDPCARGCSTSARRARSTCPSTTARAGNRCRPAFRTPPCTGWSCRSTLATRRTAGCRPGSTPTPGAVTERAH